MKKSNYIWLRRIFHMRYLTNLQWEKETTWKRWRKRKKNSFQVTLIKNPWQNRTELKPKFRNKMEITTNDLDLIFGFGFFDCLFKYNFIANSHLRWNMCTACFHFFPSITRLRALGMCSLRWRKWKLYLALDAIHQLSFPNRTDFHIFTFVYHSVCCLSCANYSHASFHTKIQGIRIDLWLFGKQFLPRTFLCRPNHGIIFTIMTR